MDTLDFLYNVCNIKTKWLDFPCSALVKNLPASAGDMGLSPGAGKPHMPWSN